MGNQTALQAVLKTLVDGAKDVVSAAKPGQSVSQRVADFENLVEDALQDVSALGDIGAELAALQPSDIVPLLGDLVSDIGGVSPYVQGIFDASTKLLSDGEPDVLALITAIKNKPAPAPAPASPPAA